jgi:hypothetical protein
VEVIWREAGHSGQPIEIERLVEVDRDVVDHALDAAAVVEDGKRLGHGSSQATNLRDDGLIAIAKFGSGGGRAHEAREFFWRAG